MIFARSRMRSSTFSLLPMKKHLPPVRFSRLISISNKSHPAIRSLGCDRASSHRHAMTMLAPSGMSASPRSSASAKRGSFRAVLYECALTVLMSFFPCGTASSSLIDRTSGRVFRVMCMIL